MDTKLAEWEKIIASYTSDKGLMTKLYRELQKLNHQKNQWPKWNEQTFFKGRSLNYKKRKEVEKRLDQKELINIEGNTPAEEINVSQCPV
jgi:hypothetical protein